jgi:arylsulfatase A-like enzyme
VRRARTLAPFAYVAIIACASSLSCDRPLPPPSRPIANADLVIASQPASANADAAILIVIDGVRWQDIFQRIDDTNELPNLRSLAQSGAAIGSPRFENTMTATGPNFVSMPGYTEIFSGRSPTDCADNDCAATTRTTLLDDLRSRAKYSTFDIAVFSSWESIARAASAHPESIVMSTGRHGGSHRDILDEDLAEKELIEQASIVDSAPGERDYRADANTADIALRYLEYRRPRFLFLGLGDTDEYAHQGNVPKYIDALKYADGVVGRVRAALRTMGERGRKTAILVTADHGREKAFRGHGGWAPESSRVWLIAGGAGIESRGEVDAERAVRLADVAPTIRACLGDATEDDAKAATLDTGSPIDAILAKRASSSRQNTIAALR